MVMDFHYEDQKDITRYRKLMRVVDPDGNKQIEKEHVVEFFQLPGFLLYEEAVNLNDRKKMGVLNEETKGRGESHDGVSSNSDAYIKLQSKAKKRKRTLLAKYIEDASDKSRGDTLSTISPSVMSYYNYS